jgi:hypothetical protein
MPKKSPSNRDIEKKRDATLAPAFSTPHKSRKLHAAKETAAESVKETS